MGEQILVPVDRSAHSDRALEYAVDSFPDAELTVLHVINPSSYWYGNTDGYIYSDEIEAWLRNRGEAVLEDARRTAAGHDREVRTELKLGSPSRTITEYVNARGIDHVVLGSHGRDGVSRMLLGSVAETVTRRAPVPVTIVR
ncbi:universal stress protein [Natronococcus occultus]|uniref:Universal stress protein UspA-like protein n=1 Tax=Natronococcus occultus SP4 TaxID=694430 RepID=L0JVR3_9EURY|nr:universal stress protein [Natronococcus occultus]AGB36385.1 universal stress protein UspA-like protein [Natronococcus occultus SP4]